MIKEYDVIIIGAGIGGLVCGSYIAKAGMRVLIIEQHDKPGGYCTSFERKGYTFDVGSHYLGAGRENGNLWKIIRDFSLNSKMTINRLDPCDKVIMPDLSFKIRKDPTETIQEIKNVFKEDDKTIDAFFDLISTRNFFELYSTCKNKTFKELLDKYFSNPRLKAVLSVFLGNIGLPASKAAATAAAALYREFILDPGYYPKGGMQVFADALAAAFKEVGGNIIFNKKVVKILTKNNGVTGVIVGKNSEFKAKYIVSNADAKETFEKLLDVKCNLIVDKLNRMKTDFSALAIYLGVGIPLENILKDKYSTWYFTTYDIEACYADPMYNFRYELPKYLLCTFPSFHDSSMAPKGKTSMAIFSPASFMNKSFWESNSKIFAKKMIKKAEEIIPGFSKNIEVMEIATPYTFYKYTSNQNGALYGWACTLDQVEADVFPQKTDIENLFLAGHWCTNGIGQGGISEVIYSGETASKLILKRKSNEKVA